MLTIWPTPRELRSLRPSPADGRNLQGPNNSRNQRLPQITASVITSDPPPRGR